MWTAILAACVGFAAPLPDRLGPGDAQGDPLPARAVARLGTVRWRTGTDALLVAYLPDGKSVLTVNRDLVAHVWDPVTGTTRVRFDASGGAGVRPVSFTSSWSQVALSADGKALAVLAADGAVHLFDPATGKERAKLDVKADNSFSYCLALSPDGKWLAVAEPRQPVVLWDVVGKKEVGPFAPTGRVLPAYGLVFTADGKQLLQAATAGNVPPPPSAGTRARLTG